MPGRGSWKRSLEFWVRWERREKRNFGVPVISPWAATLAVKGAEYTCRENTNSHLKTTQRAPSMHVPCSTQHVPHHTQHVPHRIQHIPGSIQHAPSMYPYRAACSRHPACIQHAAPCTTHHTPRSSILNMGRKYPHPHPYLSSFSVLEGSTRLPSTPGWKGDLGLLGWGVQLRDSPGLSTSILLGS